MKIKTEDSRTVASNAKEVSSPDIDTSINSVKPEHIAIIMDGNNRWAKLHGLQGSEGHRQGAKALKQTVKNCAHFGVKALTVFAFSSENWRRPQSEVEQLMQLFMEALRSEVEELKRNDVKLSFIGDLSAFSPDLQASMQEAASVTAGNSRLNFNVAVNYGGRWDITQAARQIATLAVDGKVQIEEIDEALVDRHVMLADQPPVDLCIRTSGEERISNFMLWQIAYSEIYFAPCLWPDFDLNQLGIAIDEFGRRQRRFGRSSEQLQSDVFENPPC